MNGRQGHCGTRHAPRMADLTSSKTWKLLHFEWRNRNNVADNGPRGTPAPRAAARVARHARPPKRKTCRTASGSYLIPTLRGEADLHLTKVGLPGARPMAGPPRDMVDKLVLRPRQILYHAPASDRVRDKKTISRSVLS